MFPTILELKEYVRDNHRVTICGLRDAFGQEGDGIVRKKERCCGHKGMVIAYGINLDFYEHLLVFMEEDYVICSVDMAICNALDTTRYTGHDKFLPLVLSIEEYKVCI